MLFTQSFSRFIAIISITAIFVSSLPAQAEVNTKNSSPILHTAVPCNTAVPCAVGSSALIAQANTASEIADIAAAGTIIGSKKQKGELLITDSLWGNLILDLAYQRDPEIKKIMKRLNIINIGTMGIIAGVAGGTLAQGIITLATLNPAHGNESYLPSSLGIGFAGLTLVTFVGRAAANHCLIKTMRNRQLEIKHKVEAILANIESSRGEDKNAQNELIALVGQRATNEWLQLWRSTNLLASAKPTNISMTNVHTAKDM